MKRVLATAATVFFIGVAAPQAQAKDACQSFMCMAGEVMGGSGGASCKPAISDFFSIVVLGSAGQMLTGHTADKREDFLKQCDGADPDMVSQVISEFGRSAGL